MDRFQHGVNEGQSLSSNPATNVPRLQSAIQMANDTTMRDSPDMSGAYDARSMAETSEDDEDSDSMTDESSIDGDHNVPQGTPIAKLPTGLCYDERMRYHSEVAAPTADSVHPEDPRRIFYIYKELCEAGLVAETAGHAPVIDPPLKRINAREATRDEICLVHTSPHYAFVQETLGMSDEALIDLSESAAMDSIYFNSLSYFCGKLAAGGAIEACRAVVSRQVKNAIAVIRPPGHHAEVDRTMGFCLFNNVCIASRVCQNEFREECRKILILDWDVHHGNGCQKAFYDDPNILYISLHVHMNGHFYPSGPEGDMYHCGEGLGVGKNINIPWETKGMGDGDYMYAFQHVVMPIATEFDPDLVIVAAGFDAAAGDELGGCFVSPACYAHMTHMLMSLANGKIAVCLEGGYNFQAISKSALAVTRTLMGEPPDRLQATQATEKGIKVVQQVRAVQSRYWGSIHPKESEVLLGGNRLNDIIREWQALTLYDKCQLTELQILRDTVSKSFSNQVLASPDYDRKRNLLLFFHDPPDFVSRADPLTNERKLHETWIRDSTQLYIKEALALDMGVIDVNIPENITIDEPTLHDSRFNDTAYNTSHESHRNPVTVEYASKSSDLARKEGEKLATYIWENYVDPFPFRRIIIMGAGHAFHAIARVVADLDARVHESNVIPAIISFISEQPVRALSNANNPWLGPWYRDHSRVYIAHHHSLWNRDKKSRKYGTCVRAPEKVFGLNAMMDFYKKEVWTRIGEIVRVGDEDDEDDADDTEDEAALGEIKNEKPVGIYANLPAGVYFRGELLQRNEARSERNGDVRMD